MVFFLLLENFVDSKVKYNVTRLKAQQKIFQAHKIAERRVQSTKRK